MRRRTKEKRRSKEFSEETEVMVVLGLIMTLSKARTQQYIGQQLMLDLNKNIKYLKDGRLDANHRKQTLLRSPQPDREEHSPQKTQQKHKKKHFQMVKSASLEKARENKRAVESMQTPVAAARSWTSTETSQIASGNRDACIVS
jgi:hypothetical protein